MAQSVRTLRTRNEALKFTGKTAVVVGGTAGIGRGVAVRLAKADVSVTILGRSAERGAEVVDQMQAVSTTAKHAFVPCNAMSLKDVSKFCADFSSTNRKLDYLVCTQGMATLQGRTETAEGIDEKLCLHYFSRVAFAQGLLPLLKAGDHPRFLSVLSGGVHSPYSGWSTDFEMKTSYSLANAANGAGFYNDIAMEMLSRENPEVAFVHAAPGFVNTNWGTELPGVLRGVVRCLQVFGKSPEDAGEMMGHALFSDEFSSGWGLMAADGSRARHTSLHDAARDGVWASTKAVLQRVLGQA